MQSAQPYGSGVHVCRLLRLILLDLCAINQAAAQTDEPRRSVPATVMAITRFPFFTLSNNENNADHAAHARRELAMVRWHGEVMKVASARSRRCKPQNRNQRLLSSAT